MLIDPFGRPITYLRVSVTDRCNFRCIYCLPPEGVEQLTHGSIMRYEEIAKVVQVAAENGISEVRLTGGEPLVRAGLPDLVAMIAAIRGITDISLTTNGTFLEELAEPLARAGLKRVNISLDTLQAEKFARITRGGNLEKIWRGVAAAEAYGLSPVKFNTVVMRGINDDELVPIARLSMDKPWEIRFIELMPVNRQVDWDAGFPLPLTDYLSVQEMRETLQPLEMQSVSEKIGSGPARLYKIPGARGFVGFISPLGEHFCATCNRLRLTADGYLRPCLLSDIEVPILDALRRNQDILPLLEKAVGLKPIGHELKHNKRPVGRCMLQIGG